MSRPAPVTPNEPDPPAAGRLWSIDDIATYLNVSRRGVERLKSAGRLPRPALMVGRLPRWRPRDVIAMTEGGSR